MLTMICLLCFYDFICYYLADLSSGNRMPMLALIIDMLLISTLVPLTIPSYMIVGQTDKLFWRFRVVCFDSEINRESSITGTVAHR